MGIEIERKFLVGSTGFLSSHKGTAYRQGYLCDQPERTVRVRIAGDKAFLTIKGMASGAARAEYEYPIPVADAAELLDNLCLKPLIEKLRYKIPFGKKTFEVDVFGGENHGLVVAEVELDNEEEEVSLPPWLGEEVTGDHRYSNANLVGNPFSRWGQK